MSVLLSAVVVATMKLNNICVATITVTTAHGKLATLSSKQQTGMAKIPVTSCNKAPFVHGGIPATLGFGSDGSPRKLVCVCVCVWGGEARVPAPSVHVV